nr:FGGY-family carbohydrate kinase [Paenibacillus sp. VKM B-2647]
MLGTSGSMRIVWEAGKAAIADPGQWCYRVDRRRFAGGMALSEGGNAVAWARKSLLLGAPAEIEANVVAMPPDGHGLTVLPFFLGARSPDWIDGRTAVFAGITAATSPLDMYRAVLESVAIRFALLKRRLDAARPGQRRVVATGAAFLQSSAWPQIVADCLGEEIMLSGVSEGSLRGAAILALEELGCIASIGALESPITAVVNPDAEAHAIYAKAMERHKRLDEQMISMNVV